MSLQTMFRNIAEKGANVMLIRSTNNYIFGCFASEEWRSSDRYFGTGESFVFSFGKMEDGFQDLDLRQVRKRYKRYQWAGKNDFTLYSDSDTIAVGGGGVFAITVDANFYRGMS